jgi:CheY-like chemotaxis protein
VPQNVKEKVPKPTSDRLPIANAFEGDSEKYMTLGMDEYLTKPVKKSDFEKTIQDINIFMTKNSNHLFAQETLIKKQ